MGFPMAEQGINHGCRRFLTATTAVVGGVGGVFAAVPFIKAWQPSARAQTAGAPVIAARPVVELAWVVALAAFSLWSSAS